jgi:two-component sensor histidine kinase
MLGHVRRIISAKPAQPGEMMIRTKDGCDRFWRFVHLPPNRMACLFAWPRITERKPHEEHVRLLMCEINHRAKNMLSLVQAIASQL